MTTDKLRTLKVVFFDADGVFFTGHETWTTSPDQNPLVTKTRFYPDGQGLSFLRHMSIRIVFVTGEGEPLNSIVEKINNLPSVQSGLWEKVEIFSKQNAKGAKIARIDEWCLQHNISLSDAGYMGDDINDFEPMTRINKAGGFTVAPQNATRRIKAIAQVTTAHSGGHGAIREFAEMVVDACGLDESTFPPA